MNILSSEVIEIVKGLLFYRVIYNIKCLWATELQNSQCRFLLSVETADPCTCVLVTLTKCPEQKIVATVEVKQFVGQASSLFFTASEKLKQRKHVEESCSWVSGIFHYLLPLSHIHWISWRQGMDLNRNYVLGVRGFHWLELGGQVPSTVHCLVSESQSDLELIIPLLCLSFFCPKKGTH